MSDRIIGFSAGTPKAERLDEYVQTDEDRILKPGQRDALENVRAIMNEVRTLAPLGLVDPETTAAVDSSIEQLDDPFLLVVVGEFNAGKSALINALLGEAVLTEGVTPTTTNICVLRHADHPGHAPGDGVETVVGHADLLRDIHVVDTPGTNAITREHEALTSVTCHAPI